MEVEAKSAMNVWIAVYDHRHGQDAWPLFQQYEPTLEQLLETDSTFNDMWEGDRPGEEPGDFRQDEAITFHGPYDIPVSILLAAVAKAKSNGSS